MVTITTVAKFQDTLEDEIEDLCGEVTHTDTDWGYRDDGYGPVYWEVEAYWPDEQWDADLEQEVLDLVDGTGWEVDTYWDAADRHDEHGVLFTRD